MVGQRGAMKPGSSTTLIEAGRNGRIGASVAKKLWPELILTDAGGSADKRGTDGYSFGLFGNERVQIKFDSRIAESGNIYHEFYEKTLGFENKQYWRSSPHAASWYLFVTTGQAMRVHVDVLAQVEIGMRLTKIKPTSIGFLIPWNHLVQFGVEVKTW